MIDQWDQADEARRIRSRQRTVGEYFAAEQLLLAPLPDEPFETGRLFTPRVDRNPGQTNPGGIRSGFPGPRAPTATPR